jgi:preprotein translocase SecE subunit
MESAGVRKMKGFFGKLGQKARNAKDFLIDTPKELHNVTWPSGREVRGTTVVVICCVFFFGFYLFLVDFIVNNGMQYLLNALSTQP